MFESSTSATKAPLPLIGLLALPAVLLLWLVLEGLLAGSENWNRYLVGMVGGSLILVVGAGSGALAVRRGQRRALGLWVFAVNGLAALALLTLLLLG